MKLSENLAKFSPTPTELGELENRVGVTLGGHFYEAVKFDAESDRSLAEDALDFIDKGRIVDQHSTTTIQFWLTDIPKGLD